MPFLRSLSLFILLLTVSFGVRAEYIKTVAKLNMLRSDVQASEKKIQSLLGEKRRARKPEKLRQVMGAIVQEYEIFEKLVEKYDAARARAGVRYPGKRRELHKFHPKYKKRTLEQMAREDGVPELLNELKVFMKSQYGVDDPEVTVSVFAEGNISGDMKSYQIQLQKQQGSFEDWSERPVLER